MSLGALILAVLTVVATAVALVVVMSRKQKSVVAGFLAAARAQALKSRAGVELNQGKYPKLILRVRAPDHGQFEVRREGAADRLVESLSLARPVRTSDPAFGERFHVDSDDEAFASAFFADLGKRTAVSALFAAGCTAVKWEDGHATAVWEGFAPKDPNADFVGAAASALRTLTLNVPAAGPAPLAADGWSERKFSGLAAAGIVAGLVSVYATVMFDVQMPWRPVDGFGLFRDSLRFSVPLAVVFTGGCLSVLRGKSWFLMAAGKLLLMSALFFPAAGYLGYACVNGALDEAAAESFVLPVTGTRRSSGKHTSYYIYVAPWRPGQDNPRFSVGSAAYRSARPGRTRAHLTTRPGRLGREWIVSLSFSDS
jgi:hypothetical protein